MKTATARLAAERRFYVGAAIGIVVSALVRVRGVVMFAWIALFVTQTVLVARHRVDWHRRLGILGAALAAVIVIADTATVIAAVRRDRHVALPAAPSSVHLGRAVGVRDRSLRAVGGGPAGVGALLRVARVIRELI